MSDYKFEKFLSYSSPDTECQQPKEQWYDAIITDHLYSSPWEPTSLNPLTQDVRFIVELCGRDPLKMTVKDMDQLDLRFFCARQYSETGIRTILKWREAVIFFASLVEFYLFLSSHRSSIITQDLCG